MTDNALDRLTLAERAALTSGESLWRTQAIERAGIPSITLSDGPHGVRRQPDDGDHLGVGHSTPATCFPPAVGLGSSWDPELVRRVGEALGRESRAMDVQVLLGPGVNIKRSPLCGRNFEYFSEDPRLSGVLGAALVLGIQSQGVGAAVKHFAANNQETDRMRVSAEVDERTLREIYLPAFQHVVTVAKPWMVMSAYNRVNGVYASEHPWLLTEVLRDEWGFRGVVVSDWGAVDDRVAALWAGLDLEMPTSGRASDASVVKAVEAGALDQELLDASAARVLALVARAQPGEGTFDAGAHHRLAREVAGQCAVLLKNDGVLPLGFQDSVAVVGELARTPRYQGAGSSHIVPTRLDDVLTEMRALAGRELEYAPGYRLGDAGRSPELEEEARAVAARATTTVVCLGLPAEDEGEGYDRTHLELPDNQRALLDVVAATGTRVVVVLSNGGVVRVADWDGAASAVLEGWLLGQAGGGAIADILYGEVNPSGRLAETIPLRLEDTASYLDFPGELGTVRYTEGVFVGYRYHDALDAAVSYPFGHGLSYTEFGYSDLDVHTRGSGEELVVRVSVRITNLGDRAGQEVAQVYVAAPSNDVRRPARELRAFRKVTLEPGASTTVRFYLAFRDFAYFHPVRRRWTIDPGTATIHVGASSRDLRVAATLVLEGSKRPVPAAITPDSSLADWLAAPGGLDVLQREMRPPAETGQSHSRFLTEPALRMAGSVPVRRLARFPGAYLDPERLDKLADEVNERAGW
ncbi:glycoside hydrolase family 3 C-terminal domain-containing protein [Nonomuraea endophytica]|uniref:Exo-alpha-(1->6)-L-arabinopyranosidase n=1 Tax=Nonomuraea endophytica TaxID=714136 RepID=A0A7W8EDK7_9ACTN|nr:glycoside hydrolase family 3 C-terminal domain-containing protein [Nonomuraea endophytica]MBB5076645.1 beta-glucosidase [Nonomuraea endophytica]